MLHESCCMSHAAGRLEARPPWATPDTQRVRLPYTRHAGPQWFASDSSREGFGFRVYLLRAAVWRVVLVMLQRWGHLERVFQVLPYGMTFSILVKGRRVLEHTWSIIGTIQTLQQQDIWLSRNCTEPNNSTASVSAFMGYSC